MYTSFISYIVDGLCSPKDMMHTFSFSTVKIR